jgi:hypothetical protein
MSIRLVKRLEEMNAKNARARLLRHIMLSTCLGAEVLVSRKRKETP